MAAALIRCNSAVKAVFYTFLAPAFGSFVLTTRRRSKRLATVVKMKLSRCIESQQQLSIAPFLGWETESASCRGSEPSSSSFFGVIIHVILYVDTIEIPKSIFDCLVWCHNGAVQFYLEKLRCGTNCGGES